MSSINRDVNGVVDFLFDKLEETDRRDDVEFKEKIKMVDILLRNVWKGARMNLDYKALMMRAPDIAQNERVVLQLGKTPDALPTEK